MPYIIEQTEDRLCLKIEGKFDAALAREMQNELEQKYKNSKLQNIIFDFAETKFLASSGLRVMVFAKEGLGHDIKITAKNSNKLVLEVMKMSGMNNFVEIIK